MSRRTLLPRKRLLQDSFLYFCDSCGGISCSSHTGQIGLFLRCAERHAERRNYFVVCHSRRFGLEYIAAIEPFAQGVLFHLRGDYIGGGHSAPCLIIS